MKNIHRTRTNGFTQLDVLIVICSVATILGLAVVVPHHVKPRANTQRGACINNLRQIEGAKEQWMLEAKKSTTDTPTPDDLYGAGAYIKQTPSCPSGGIYLIGSLGAYPKCSVPGHSL